MSLRTRKLAGTLMLLAFLIAYVLLAMAAAIILEVRGLKSLELAYYVVAGLAWTLPAGWIIHWMHRAPSKTGTGNL